MQKTGDDLADEAVEKVLDDHGVDAVNAIMRTLVRNDQPVPEVCPRRSRITWARA